MLKSTLIGGLAFGVAGGLPIVGALNCACCALVISAGFFAGFLYSNECKRSSFAFGPANGAVVGLVAGMFYAVAATLIGRIFMPSIEDLDRIIEQLEDNGFPPEATEGAAQIFETLDSGMGLVLSFFFTLLLAAAFSTIGGLIAGAVFKNEPPPAPPAGGSVPTIDVKPEAGSD
jgi:hypothetical protein